MRSLAGLVLQRLFEGLHPPLEPDETSGHTQPAPTNQLAKGKGKRSQMGPPGRIDESKGPKEEPQIAAHTQNASVMARRKPMSIKIIRSTTEYLATSAVA